MFARLKINTALLICATFIFKLLFVNIAIISSLRQHNYSALASYSSSMTKRRKSIDAADSMAGRGYATEICEEASNDEDDLSKINPATLIQVLYSFLSNKVVSSESKTLFGFIHSKLSSRKYLAISVLRI